MDVDSTMRIQPARLRPRLCICMAVLTVATCAAGPEAAAAEQASVAVAAVEEGGQSTSSLAEAARVGSRKRTARDIDGDGIPNGRDNDMDGDRVANTRDRDVDGDRVVNKRDRDIDGDRRRNGRDREMDGDRLRNSRDRDIDADRLRNCPRDPDMDADRVANRRDLDMDADGLGNARDRDIDADAIPNDRDNDMDCDGIANRFDPDMDGDGILNVVDSDSDSDGIALDGSYPANVRLPKTFFGIVAMHPFATEGLPRAIQLRQVAFTGGRTLRQTFEWADIETSPGVYNFDTYDLYVADATRLGFDVLPVLFSPPSFRSSQPASGAQRGTYPPSSNEEFAGFAARLVRRYGPNGSFWIENPDVPRRPIVTWQIWNEPHIGTNWPAGPNPGAYTAMLKTVSAGIKAADPGAEVLNGAISQSSTGTPMLTYLQGMYNAGAKGSFDTLAVNPYAPAPDQVYELMISVRRLADANGDVGRPVRVTELGWATGGPASPYNVGYWGQVEMIRRTWAGLVRHRVALGLRGLVYYAWRDIAPYMPPYQDFFGLHTGLLEIDGRPKPGLWSLAQAVYTMSAP